MNSEEGHIAKECEKPKNPANATCRNCDQVGHFSKDCPEPKDWSKVKCNTCGESESCRPSSLVFINRVATTVGHTVRKCPQANAEGEGNGSGGANGANGYDDATNGGTGAAADSNWETAVVPLQRRHLGTPRAAGEPFQRRRRQRPVIGKGWVDELKPDLVLGKADTKARWLLIWANASPLL